MGVEEGSEVLGETRDLIRRVAGAEGDAQAGRADRDGGRADRLDVPAAFEQGRTQRNGGFVGADRDAEDRGALGFGDLEAELADEMMDVVPEAISSGVAFGPAGEVDRVEDLGGDGGGEARAVDEAAGACPEPGTDSGRGGCEGAGTAEGFSKGANEEGRVDAVVGGEAGTIFKKGEAVGLVEVEEAAAGEVGF